MIKYFVVFVFLGLCSASFFPELPSPLFFWAGQNYFTTQNAEFKGTLTDSDFTNFIAEIIDQPTKETPLSKFHQDTKTPEIIVLFLDQNRKDLMSSSQIEPLVSTATSSLIAPYYYSKTSPKIELSSLFSSKNLTILHSSSMKDAVIPIDSLTTYLDNHKELFQNNVPELLIVHLFNDGDKLLSQISNKIAELSSGNYLSILTIDITITPLSQKISVYENHITTTHRNMWYFAHARFWPIEIWEGVLVSFLLIILAIIGLGCTAQLQTPDKWVSQNRFVCQFTEIPDP